MIELHNVTKRYPNGHEAVRNVSLNVEAGAMAFLTGHSGAGKSTLLRLITLVERCTRGQIIVSGQNLGRLSRRGVARYRRDVGMVFQDHRLLMDRTVFDNVALPLVIAGHSHSDVRRWVRAALDGVGLLGKERLYPEVLSGGEQQRIGIARAVVHKPSILLADEPTGNLDPDLSREIMGLFERFNQVVSALVYAAPASYLVRRLKFGGSLTAGAALGALLAEVVGDGVGLRPECVVPVPLHDRRLRQRGFNQADEIARPVARSLGLACRTDLCRRVRATKPQSSLVRPHDRYLNLKQAFAISNLREMPRHVAIVDDVMTTGATVNALASALRRRGVERVQVWVAARALGVD